MQKARQKRGFTIYKIKREFLKLKFSLIVSLSTPETEIDIYTPVANMIKIPVPTEISITE